MLTELRRLAAHPAFAAAAVVSLALGIGVNTALFGVIHALFLRPLPYKDAARLVILWNRSPGLNIAEDWFSTAQYFDIKTGHSGFEDLAIAIGANNNLGGDGHDPERVGCIRTSSNLLPMLGATTALGRLFDPAEDAPGRPASAILSHGTWIRRYGGDPSAVGRTILLNGQPFRIVGVLNDRFLLPREVLPTLGVAEDGEIFLPLPLAADARDVRTREDYNIVGKLKRGVSVASAQAEMDVLTARLRARFPQTYPPNGGLTFGIVPLLEQVVGSTRRPLAILLGAVGFVLLISCANVANLLLSRALARRRELAVRAALGASRWRLVGQLVKESIALSSIAAIAGLLLAWAAVRGIRLMDPANVPRLRDISIDGAVATFAIALALLAGALSGLVPAVGSGAASPADLLADGNRSSTGTFRLRGGRRNLLSMMVVIELSLSTILLAGAGLLIRSFARLQNVDPGFDRRGVLTFELMMSGRAYGNADAVRTAYRRLWEELDRLPGVTASGGITSLPLSGFFAWGPITIEGRTPAAGEKFINADVRTVGGRYFEAMRIALLRGRLFTDHDAAGAPRVAIIDEFMAREFWPGQDPIGKRIHYGDAASTSPWMTVVGVVGRVKQYALEADGRIALYTPQTQATARSQFVVVRTDGDPSTLAASVAGAVHRVDPALPLYHVRTMEERVMRSLSQQRFAASLMTLFAGTALALALVGIYAVMSYRVAQSVREVGIRMALGATPRVILAWSLRHAMALTLAGSAIGLADAALLGRVMRGLTFGVGAVDPVAFGSVALLLTATALLASYLPVRRAARVDPAVTLRAD